MGEELFEGLPGIDWEGVQRTLRERVSGVSGISDCF